jgi:hypothetical protein
MLTIPASELVAGIIFSAGGSWLTEDRNQPITAGDSPFDKNGERFELFASLG